MVFCWEVGLGLQRAVFPKWAGGPIRGGYSVCLSMNLIWTVAHPPTSLVPFVPGQLQWAEALPPWVFLANSSVIAAIAVLAHLYERSRVIERRARPVRAQRAMLRTELVNRDPVSIPGWLYPDSP